MQAKILPVLDKFIDYAKAVELSLKKEGFRCETDERAEKIGYKIREAQLEKAPYMLIVGGKEAAAGSVSVRKREEGDLGSMPVSRLVEMLCREAKNSLC